ncbi:three-Cys-motif partner protein TcmP [Thiohalorhabdus methylotrophus]|uniref:Three-Cys-motif partner protein TcmP n=1 Tax=Thiohalorhabdus methylotrophus TaxID=3242694 RepID=A0ABV4TS68_9GAMM
MTENVFGGAWTLLKLGALEDYLHGFTTALKKQKFKLLYIDAFAGSGAVKTKYGDPKEAKGSAQVALDNGGFDYYFFIESDEERYEGLRSIRKEHSDKKIAVQLGDANSVLQEKLPNLNTTNWRGVIFLDPYGMELDWRTLEVISATQALDVWYLFPLSGVYRQAALDFSSMDEDKKAAMDRILGTQEWREKIYKEVDQGELFGSRPVRREPGPDDLENFARERLDGLFSSVLPPKRLCMENSPLFSLFFATSNPNPKAIGPAKRIAGHILNNLR